MAPAVSFQNVSKAYRLGQPQRSLRASLAQMGRTLRRRQPEREVALLWALRDVSFELERGEILGVIGPNGAGKTTILKLLSHITQPTSGHIEVQGRLSALIELGAGFHPELTGRENIYLNAAILGLSSEEVEDKFDEIVAFSGLERFLDTPVKRYSSGMYVRLGFAVAAHVEPEVLLVDEVLAVGDAAFRQRCVERMRSLRDSGTTMVFISHNMHMVRTMCNRALLLSQGRVRSAGEPGAVISEYEKLLVSEVPREPQGAALQLSSHPETRLRLQAVEVAPAEPGAEGALASDRAAQIRIHYNAPLRQSIGRIYVKVIREDGTICSLVHSGMDASAGRDLHQLVGEGVVTVSYRPLQLVGGTYSVTVGITDVTNSLVLASGQSAPFQVSGGDSASAQGVYIPAIHWTLQPAEPAQSAATG